MIGSAALCQSELGAAITCGLPARDAVDAWIGPQAALRIAVAAASTISAHFSPIMMVGALVLPLVSVGMIEASATRRPAMPWTRNWASTTAIGSAPILQVPTG